MNALASQAESGDALQRMNRLYRRQRHVYDFTRKYYLLGRDRLIDRLNPLPGDGVLEIGCGTGRNLITAAQRYPEAHFYGIDVSTEMLTQAHGAIERAGLQGRIKVMHGDATAFQAVVLFGRPQFERVFISYSLSMIPDWRRALSAALNAVAPGGELHVVDFGSGNALPRWFVAGLRHWLHLFEVTPRDGLEREMLTLAAQAHAPLRFERPYRGYAQYAVLHRPQ